MNEPMTLEQARAALDGYKGYSAEAVHFDEGITAGIGASSSCGQHKNGVAINLERSGGDVRPAYMILKRWIDTRETQGS